MISYITIFKRNIIVKIVLLLFFLQFVIAIMFSRLYLGVHSIDQILLGALLGLAVYYLHFFVLEYHIKDAETFFSYFTEKLYILIYSIVFLITFIVFVLVFTVKDYSKYNDQYAEMLNRLCGEIKLYKYFQYDGFNGGLVIFTLIGSYYGIVILLYMLRNKTIRLNDLNNWNLVENWKKDIIRVLFMIPFALPLILYFLVPGQSSLAVIYIFKDIVPFLVGMICIYGIGIYVCVIYKRANPFILEERTLENEN